MRVALDVSAVPARPAGAGRYVVEVASRLAARCDLRLVTARGDASRWKSIASDADVVSSVPPSRIARLAYERYILGRSVASRDVEVWHGPHYTLPRGLSVPKVTTIHDLTFFTHPEWHDVGKAPFFRRAITWAAAHADVVICVSEWTARELRQLVDVRAQVVVAPLGVDAQRFSRSDQPPTPSVPYVLFLGTLEPRKGVDVLLDAFTQIASHDDHVELWLAGQAGWGTDSIERAIADHPHKDRIKRLGYVPDDELSALLAGARAVAYPSRGEGFGLPVPEALAAGAVVVTTKDTVMAEVAGDAALLVPPGDAASLADALESAISMTAEQRNALADRGSQVAQQFTWDRCVDQHVLAYQHAVANQRS